MMKRTVLAALAALGVMAGEAAAQEGQPAGLSVNLNADVSALCGVYNDGGTEIAVDFGELSNTPVNRRVRKRGGFAFYSCSSPEGFSRTITSQNGGYLVREGSQGGEFNQIGYQIRHGGGRHLRLGWTALTSPATTDHSGRRFLRPQRGPIHFRLNGVKVATGANGAPSTSVFAGAYSDVVTITITSS